MEFGSSHFSRLRPAFKFDLGNEVGGNPMGNALRVRLYLVEERAYLNFALSQAPLQKIDKERARMHVCLPYIRQLPSSSTPNTKQ
jgi:hypothetical protein